MTITEAEKIVAAVRDYGEACVAHGAGVEGAYERQWNAFNRVLRLAYGDRSGAPDPLETSAMHALAREEDARARALDPERAALTTTLRGG